MASDLDAYMTSEAPRIAFGSRDNQTMPADWASSALTWLFANRPQQFAAMMSEGVFGIKLDLKKTPGRQAQ